MAIGATAWPGTPDTTATLLLAANLATTTLATEISAVATSIVLTDASLFPASGAITLISGSTTEIVYYSSKTSNTLTVQTRGANGSTASIFAAGSTVQMRIIAQHHNLLASCIVNLQAEVDLKLATTTAASLYQPLDADLTAIAGLLSTGILQRTAANTWSFAAVTGMGDIVKNDTPTLVTPILGVATATTINKVTITAPATASTLTIADGVTLIVNASTTLNSLTADRALVSSGAGVISAASVTSTELGYVSGVTSALQTQLNAKQASGSYITALTGHVTATGPGSVAATIAAGVVTNAMLAGSIAIGKIAATGTPDGTTFLRGDGSWQTAGVTVPGSDTWVIFNSGGVLGADAGLAFDPTTNILSVGGGILGYTGNAWDEFIAQMSSNYMPSYVSVTGSATASGNDPSQALDNSPLVGNAHYATFPATHLITATFDYAPRAATRYTIMASAGGSAPKDWTFQGSANGSAWTTLDTQTGITTWGASETKAYTFANTTEYKYYRWNITAIESGTLMAIQELGIQAASELAIRQSADRLELGVVRRDPASFVTIIKSPSRFYQAATFDGPITLGGGTVLQDGFDDLGSLLPSLTFAPGSATINANSGTKLVFPAGAGQYFSAAVAGDIGLSAPVKIMPGGLAGTVTASFATTGTTFKATATTDVVVKIQAAASQSANLLNLLASDGTTVLASFDANGIFTKTSAGIGATSTDGIVLQNTTAATVGAQQYSPRLRLTGQGWKTTATAASQTVDWAVENRPVQGAANPSADLHFLSQINAGGYTARGYVTSAGNWVVPQLNVNAASSAVQAVTITAPSYYAALNVSQPGVAGGHETYLTQLVQFSNTTYAQWSQQQIRWSGVLGISAEVQVANKAHAGDPVNRGYLFLNTYGAAGKYEGIAIDELGRVGLNFAVYGTANTLPAQLAVKSNDATRIASVTRGAASQSANLTEWQSSAPATLSAVDAAGRFLAPLGALATCGYSFLGDPNTGLYSSGADVFALVTGGTARMTVGTAVDVSAHLTAHTVATTVTSKTGTYTAASEGTILCDASGGAFSINLPATAGCSGRMYQIKKTDSSVNIVTIDGDGAETIDGYATIELAFKNSAVTVQSNGTAWFIF